MDKPDSTANVKIVKYDDENISLQANASGNNMLFLGNTYYPVDWKAYIDSKPVSIYKLNHGFMGIIVPKGDHNIRFSIEPASFYIGRYITLACNIFILIGLVLVIINNKKKNLPEEVSS